MRRQVSWRQNMSTTPSKNCCKPWGRIILQVQSLTAGPKFDAELRQEPYVVQESSCKLDRWHYCRPSLPTEKYQKKIQLRETIPTTNTIQNKQKKSSKSISIHQNTGKMSKTVYTNAMAMVFSLFVRTLLNDDDSFNVSWLKKVAWVLKARPCAQILASNGWTMKESSPHRAKRAATERITEGACALVSQAWSFPKKRKIVPAPPVSPDGAASASPARGWEPVTGLRSS
eukprot:6488629-Amphidinium_carterae.1